MSGQAHIPLSPQLRSAWAKSDSEDRSLSLVAHAKDACAVAGYLYDKWLSMSVQDLIGEGSTHDEARALVGWHAAAHDVGKLSPAFACQVDHLANAMRDTGLRITVDRCDRNRIPHSIVSHRAVETYLCARGWDRNLNARSFAVVAGGHHGVPPSDVPVRSNPKMYGDSRWDAVRTEFLDLVGRISGADQYLDRWRERTLTPQQQAILTAVVIVSDWLASDADRFPLGEHRDPDSHAAQALADLDLPPPWSAASGEDLNGAFAMFDVPDGAQPNPVQSAAVDAVRALGTHGLVIIEAPMGQGKTEAALMAAEQFAAVGGQGGLFVALPTMATSNAMFARVLAWLRAHTDLGYTSIVLAHGKADLNDDFRGLSAASALTGIECDCADHAAEIVAHQWLSGRKKALLANFVVGTVDQLLFMALKARHVVLRHLALAGKVVVIDEVHAADDYMREYLKRALEWLAAYCVPVIMLSATLPSDQRIAFAQAYAKGQLTGLDRPELLEQNSYPSISAVSPTGSVTVDAPASAAEPTNVTFTRLGDDMDSLIHLLRELLADGGCAAIVRNTVRRAQETARALREVFGADVILLHSAYVAQQRAKLEQDLMKELGRNGADRPTRRIVVATQVIEQSLDLDFDVMVSDLAPIDLVLQRMGRLHRHPRIRPRRLVQPQLYLAGVVDWNDPVPVPIKPSTHVYRAYDLLCALAVLRGRDAIQIPDDIATLVQSAYKADFEPPHGWEQVLGEARLQADKQITELKSRAHDFQIWAPHDKKTLVGWLANFGSDPDGAKGYARVRDGNDSIEVILTHRVGDGVFLPKQCSGAKISAPDDAIARRARTAAIRLPYILSLPGTLDRVIRELERRTDRYDGWRTSKWLKGELALELDEDLHTELCGFNIRYDPDDGLIVERAGQ